MRTTRILAVAVLTLGVVVGSTLAGGTPKSGPQAGKRIPGPFYPLNVTGPEAGRKSSLVCKHGLSPVAMVFAREVSPSLTKLIKQLDAATAKNKDKGMGSFVVFLTDREELADKLKKLAATENIKNTVLAIDGPSGPERFEVARDADVTVVLYNKLVVVANHVFRKGQLNDQAITQIMANVPKILK
ncbi:MAG TPA: hypothetical protein VEL76_09045 [Gemmataceae bacterium]|nr:hypothetical protein [Gemmataceae bacterium]